MNLFLAAMEVSDGAVVVGGSAIGLGGLGGLVAILKQLGAFKKEIVAEVRAGMVADAQPTHTHIGPQPFEVTTPPEYVKVESYRKHAELNRKAHEDIEKEMRDAVKSIDTSVQELGREVGEIKVLRESNGTQLGVLSSQMAELNQKVGELSGVIHQMNMRPKSS